MQLGIRSKLFAASVALILTVGLACGLYLERELRGFLEQRIETELVRQVGAARAFVETRSHGATAAGLDRMADRLAGAFDSRITVIAPGGRVLGDSDLSPAEIAVVDNHGTRPEVLAALAHGHGESRRHSTTLGTDMLYVATPYQDGSRRGVVRVARPLAEVDAALSRLRALLLLAGLIGLIVAVFMSGLASHFMSRTLRYLAENARALSRRDDETAAAHIDVTSRDELGGLAGSLNRMARDIQTTVATLASERARFAAVLEGMSEAVIALDSERCIQLMNPAALALLGLARVPLDEPLIDHLRVPAVHELLADPGEARTREFQLPGKTRRRVMAGVSPHQDGSGCILVMHDVTDIRRLETVRRDFVANVSHELRTPVSIIRASAETLLDGAMDDAVHGRRLVDALHRNAERLSNLIGDLLDLSRIEAGRYPVSEEPILVAEVAREALAAVERAAQDRDISLESRLGEALRVRGDRKALDQILINYLDNAIKYTPASGRVVLSARDAGTRVRIEVIDNGPGIPSHLQQRVFERFFRVDPGRSRDMGGTGLGLSIVKHLADAMDGEAGVDPVEPHGACFWVALPRA